jgi:hypothetical protein
MKRRRQEDTLSNPFPRDIWLIVLEYAQQFECRLVSKTLIDGEVLVINNHLFIHRGDKCISWPQEDVTFDVSNKVRVSSDLWWSTEQKRMEYWNENGVMEDVTGSPPPRFYGIQIPIAAQYYVLEDGSSWDFISVLNNTKQEIEFPWRDHTFVDGKPSDFITHCTVEETLYRFKNGNPAILCRHVIEVLCIVSFQFLVLARKESRYTKKIVLYHIPTSEETLIETVVEGRHPELSLYFVGGLFLVVFSRAVIRIFEWIDAKWFQYCGSLFGNKLLDEIINTVEDVFFVIKNQLYVIVTDEQKSTIRIYQ